MRPHVTREAIALASEHDVTPETAQVVLSEFGDRGIAQQVLSIAAEAGRSPEELLHSVRLMIPDWVRKCRALGHFVKYGTGRVLGRRVHGWFCADCGKDRP